MPWMQKKLSCKARQKREITKARQGSFFEPLPFYMQSLALHTISLFEIFGRAPGEDLYGLDHHACSPRACLLVRGVWTLATPHDNEAQPFCISCPSPKETLVRYSEMNALWCVSSHLCSLVRSLPFCRSTSTSCLQASSSSLPCMFGLLPSHATSTTRAHNTQSPRKRQPCVTTLPPLSVVVV